MCKLTRLFASVLVGIVILVGCSGNETGEESQETNEDLVVAYFADFRGKNTMEDYLKRFTEETGVKVTGKPITGDFYDQLKTGYASKTEPDVFFMDIYQFGNFADAGLLLDINEYVDEAHVEKFNENLLSMFTQGGKLLGIPKDYNTLGLFYNKAMFDEAGLEYPTNDWTWDDFMAAVEKLDAHFAPQGKYALVLQNEVPRFQPILEIAGGDLSYDEKGYPVVNTPEIAKGFEIWNNLFVKGYATTPKDLGRDWDGDAFDSGDVAMTIDGNWMNSYLTDSGNNLPYGTVQIPSMNGNKANMFFTVAWSASSNTKQPENAAKFIEWITSETMISELIGEGGGAIPPMVSYENEFIQSYPERVGFVEAGKTASPFDYGLVSPTVVKEIGDFAERLRLGSETDIKAGLDKVQETIEQEYNRLKK